jgi:hypothetical protein
MAWRLKGQLIENCSCNMFCPCWFGVQELMIMDRGWCQGAITLRIDDGSSDGVDLSGRTVTIGIHFPGPTLFDGDATARVFVDDGSSDDQRDALEAIVQGRSGGPMEQIAPLVSSWLSTQTAQIDIDESDETIKIDVDGGGSMRSQLLRDPEGNAFTLQGGGFITGFGLESAELAPANGAQWSDTEFPERGIELKSGARGPMAWAG